MCDHDGTLRGLLGVQKMRIKKGHSVQCRQTRQRSWHDSYPATVRMLQDQRRQRWRCQRRRTQCRRRRRSTGAVHPSFISLMVAYVCLIYQQLLTYVPLVRPTTKRAATKLSSPVSAAEPAATIGATRGAGRRAAAAAASAVGVAALAAAPPGPSRTGASKYLVVRRCGGGGVEASQSIPSQMSVGGEMQTRWSRCWGWGRWALWWRG